MSNAWKIYLLLAKNPDYFLIFSTKITFIPSIWSCPQNCLTFSDSLPSILEIYWDFGPVIALFRFWWFLPSIFKTVSGLVYLCFLGKILAFNWLVLHAGGNCSYRQATSSELLVLDKTIRIWLDIKEEHILRNEKQEQVKDSLSLKF